MKNIFRKLGFRKPDEMEKSIVFRAQRNAYIFLIAALFAWSMYESYKVFVYHTILNLTPCMLLVAAGIIQNLSQLIMTRNAVKDDDDSFETSPLLRIIFMICVIIGIIATVTAAIVIMGVRV